MAKYDVIIFEKGEQHNRYYASDIDNKETAMKLFNKAKQLYPNSIVQLIEGDRLIGDVSSLGFGPVEFTKIKDYGFGPYDDDHYQVISFIGELSKTGTAYKSDVLRLLNYHGGGYTPNELQKTIAQNPKYFTQTGITVTLTQEGKRVLKEMSKVFGSSVHDGKIVGEDRIKSASWYRDSTTISDMAKYDVIIWEKGEQNNRYYAGDIDNKEKAMKLFNKAKQLYPNSIVQLIKGDRLIADSAEVTDGKIVGIGDARIIRANSVSVGNSIEGSGGEWLKVISVKRGSSGGVDVKVKSETTGETNSWYFMKGDLVNIRDSAEVTDGKIVGGEGRSMDGIPYGLYQEGGRSYRGFEITSSENGLRKGVYRFYNWGGGVPFGNAAVDGQFTEGQFQKLIQEGKVKLLDSVSVVGDATISNLSAGELRKGMRITSVGTYHGNNVISKVVKEKGDVVKVLFENGESESFHSFATIRVVKDSAKKMFKVKDKATGKTLIVKATDSLAAVKRVSSLKDSAYTVTARTNDFPYGNNVAVIVDANSEDEAVAKYRKVMDMEYTGISRRNNGQFYISYYNKRGDGVFKPIYSDNNHKHYFMITSNTRQYLSTAQEKDLMEVAIGDGEG